MLKQRVLGLLQFLKEQLLSINKKFMFFKCYSSNIFHSSSLAQASGVLLLSSNFKSPEEAAEQAASPASSLVWSHPLHSNRLHGLKATKGLCGVMTFLPGCADAAKQLSRFSDYSWLQERMNENSLLGRSRHRMTYVALLCVKVEPLV